MQTLCKLTKLSFNFLIRNEQLSTQDLKELLSTLMWQNLTCDNLETRICDEHVNFYLPPPAGGIKNPLVNYSVVNIFYSLYLIHWTLNIKKNRH